MNKILDCVLTIATYIAIGLILLSLGAHPLTWQYWATTIIIVCFGLWNFIDGWERGVKWRN